MTRLRKLESAKALTAKAVTKIESTHARQHSRAAAISPVYAVPAQNIAPQDYVWSSLVCKMKAHFTKQTPLEVLKQEYPEDQYEPTRAVLDMITKAATAPADTVTSGWASELAATSVEDFFRRADAEFGLPDHWRREAEVFVRSRRHCQHADTLEHADDRR